MIEATNVTTNHLTAPQFFQPNLLHSFILVYLNLLFHVLLELRSDVENFGHNEGAADKHRHRSSEDKYQCRKRDEVKAVPVAKNREGRNVDVDCQHHERHSRDKEPPKGSVVESVVEKDRFVDP